MNARTVGWSLALVAALAGACGDDGGTSDGGAAEPTDRDVGHDHPHDHSGMVVVDTVERPDGRLEIRYGDDAGSPAVMVDVTAHAPGTAPTPAQQQAAEALVDEVRHETLPYARIDAAEAAGYRRWPGIDEFHLVHPEHVTDGQLLDPAHPEFLMYDRGGTLVAAMFLAGGNDEAGPQIGGPLTVWHFHPWEPSCWTARGLLPSEELPDETGRCPGGLLYSERSPEMLHVWVIDHPGGPFSSDMGRLLADAET